MTEDDLIKGIEKFVEITEYKENHRPTVDEMLENIEKCKRSRLYEE